MIPLDGRAAVHGAIRQYSGDARGHWEGETLVVETSNFNGIIGVTGNGRLRPTSDALQMVERFTRTGRDTLQYRATVTDPKTWTAPWTVTFPLERDDSYGFYDTRATKATTRCATSSAGRGRPSERRLHG